jgi:hypothetical protein
VGGNVNRNDVNQDRRNLWSRNSLVIILTGLRTGQLRNPGSFPGRGNNYFSSEASGPDLGAHRAYFSSRTETFTRSKAIRA